MGFQRNVIASCRIGNAQGAVFCVATWLLWTAITVGDLTGSLSKLQGQVILPGVPGGWSASDTERSLAVKLAIRASACSSNAARRTALAIAAEQGMLRRGFIGLHGSVGR